MITRLATNEEICRICDSETPAVVVIRGNVRCQFCGNEIGLCQNHLDELRKELDADN